MWVTVIYNNFIKYLQIYKLIGDIKMAIKVEVFSTSTCPHCPAAIEAAQVAKDKLGDAIDVESVKIDDMEHPENRQRAIDYQIMAVPTIVIDGNVEFIGAPSDSELISKLESLL